MHLWWEYNYVLWYIRCRKVTATVEKVGLYSAYEIFLFNRQLELLFASFSLEKLQFKQIFVIPKLGHH